MHTCPCCGLDLPGRKLFVNETHRGRARRRWARGLPASAYPDGGRRGRVPMGAPTKLEAAIAAARSEWSAELILAQLHDTTAALRRRREDEQGFRLGRENRER